MEETVLGGEILNRYPVRMAQVLKVTKEKFGAGILRTLANFGAKA